MSESELLRVILGSIQMPPGTPIKYLMWSMNIASNSVLVTRYHSGYGDSSDPIDGVLVYSKASRKLQSEGRMRVVTGPTRRSEVM